MIVYSGFIYCYQTLETTQVSPTCEDNQSEVDGIYLSHEKELQMQVTVNESPVHDTQVQKPDSKGHISYDFTNMNILEQATLQAQKTDEWFPGAEGEGKGLVTNGPKEPCRNGGHVVNLDVGGYMTVCICQNAWNCTI